MRRGALPAILVLIVGVWPEVSGGWDETVVRMIVEKSIDALPKQVKKFYEGREQRLLEQLLDPVRTGRRMVFEADRLDEFPFEAIPPDRQEAVGKFGEAAIQEAGDLPWKLIETYEKLVEAFQNQDIPKIESLSVEVAFMVAELNNPLNVSKYGDGGPIDQVGLRERFEERMLEVYGDKLKFATPAAVFLDRPSEYVFSIPRSAYVWVDNILLNDYIAHMGVTSYDRFYYEGLWLRNQAIVSEVMVSLSRDISSFWYTAWVNGGKPDLPR